MQHRFIALLATLDTKAGEAAYLWAAIEARGWPASAFRVEVAHIFLTNFSFRPPNKSSLARSARL
jgi:hypothetical protein